MSSKLMQKTSVTHNTSMSTETKKSKEPPAGAKIISKSVRTEVEEIENGFILSKCYDISYEVKGQRDYTYYTKKYFSKDNPISVKINDKALADEFAD